MAYYDYTNKNYINEVLVHSLVLFENYINEVLVHSLVLFEAWFLHIICTINFYHQRLMLCAHTKSSPYNQ